MAQNILQLGDIVDIIVPEGGCTSGKGLLVDTVVAIALSTAAEGATANVVFEALATVDKAIDEAWTLGAVIYWDDSAKKFTTTSTSNTRAGVAAAAADTDATTGTLMLVQLPAGDGVTGTLQDVLTNGAVLNQQNIITTGANALIVSADGVVKVQSTGDTPIRFLDLDFPNGNFTLGDFQRSVLNVKASGNNNWHAHPNTVEIDTAAEVKIGDTQEYSSAAYIRINDVLGRIKFQNAYSGFIPPQLTTTQRDNIDTPEEGTTIYNTDVHKLQVWDGSTWQSAW